MSYTENKPMYEYIRIIPLMFLLKLSDGELKKIERKIATEKERASLALKWVRCIQDIKRSGACDGK